MTRQLWWVPLIVILAGAATGQVAGAAQQTNAQKNDERRENEAVRKARQDVKAAQDAETAAERSSRKAADELKAAERTLVQAARQLQTLRETLEDKHADAVGLVEARRAAEAAQRAYEAAGKPVLQRLAETAKYQAAVAAAKEADQRLASLRSATDGDPDLHRKQLAEAARIKLVPGQLEREALDADASLKSEREQLMAAEANVAAIRKDVDRAIEKDPALKAAAERIEQARQAVSGARRNADREGRQLADARQKLVREQQDLQQKIAADRRDDNKPNPKKNK